MIGQMTIRRSVGHDGRHFHVKQVGYLDPLAYRVFITKIPLCGRLGKDNEPRLRQCSLYASPLHRQWEEFGKYGVGKYYIFFLELFIAESNYILSLKMDLRD